MASHQFSTPARVVRRSEHQRVCTGLPRVLRTPTVRKTAARARAPVASPAQSTPGAPATDAHARVPPACRRETAFINGFGSASCSAPSGNDAVDDAPRGAPTSRGGGPLLGGRRAAPAPRRAARGPSGRGGRGADRHTEAADRGEHPAHRGGGWQDAAGRRPQERGERGRHVRRRPRVLHLPRVTSRSGQKSKVDRKDQKKHEDDPIASFWKPLSSCRCQRSSRRCRTDGGQEHSVGRGEVGLPSSPM